MSNLVNIDNAYDAPKFKIVASQIMGLIFIFLFKVCFTLCQFIHEIKSKKKKKGKNSKLTF